MPAPKWGQPELPAELTQLRGRGRGVLLLQKHKLSSAPAGGETEALSGALGCALIAISPGAINAALRGGQAADPTLPPGHGPSFTHPAGFKPGGGGPRAYHSGKPGCLWGLGGGSPSSWGDHSQVLTHAHTLGHPGVLRGEQPRAAPWYRDPPQGCRVRQGPPRGGEAVAAAGALQPAWPCLPRLGFAHESPALSHGRHRGHRLPPAATSARHAPTGVTGPDPNPNPDPDGAGEEKRHLLTEGAAG